MSMWTLSATRLVATSLVAAAVLVPVAAGPAAAGVPVTVITVTTTDDVVDGGDGLTSLREAVDLANAAGDAAEIVLAPGATYTLTICPPGSDDDTNATGDLDITGSNDVTITGNDATLEPCADLGALHALPLASGEPTLTLTGLTITGPNTYYGVLVGADTWSSTPAHRRFVGTDLEVHGFQADNIGGILVAGPATLTRVHLHDAHFDGAAVWTLGALTMADSTLEDLELSFGGLIVEEDATIDGSQFLRTGPVDIPLPLESFPTSDEAQEWPLPGATVRVDGAAVIHDSRFEDNVALYSTIGTNQPPRHLTMSDSVLHHNWNALGTMASYDFALDRVTIDGNGGAFGAGIWGGGIIRDSTISNNVVDEAHQESGAGLDAAGDTTIERSTITGNHGPSVGAITAQGDLTVLESTITGNSSSGVASPYWGYIVADDIAFVDPGSTFTIRNSVLGPGGAQPGCNLAGTAIVTLGHNFDSDGTCGLSGPSDSSDGGDPLLGPLGDNGGATETMLPLPGSPLLDAVPPATPGCAGETSQNTLVLPQGLGCEIGAAEVASTARLAGTVTTAYDGSPLAGIEVRVRTLANTTAAMTTTGPDGTWSVAGLAAGDYKVLFRDPSGDHNQIFNGSAWPFAAAPPVTVNATNTTVIDQALTADNTLGGTVTSTETGLPVAGVQVRLRTADNTYIRTATTNTSGTYTFTDLAPGDYKLLFRHPHGAYQQTFNGSAWPFSAAPPISVGPGDTITVNQAMVPVPAITGTVTQQGTGTPLAGIEIRFRTLTNTYVASTTTAPDGTWSIHLPADTYKLLYTDPTSAHTPEWHDNKPGFATATPLTHTHTATIGLTATLTPTP